MTRSFQRRCSPPRTAHHVWFVVWEDSASGQVMEATFETTQVGLHGILMNLGNPEKFVFEYLGMKF